MRTLVEDTLRLLEPEIKYSQDAAELILGTGAHESMGWIHRKQMGNGPALGYWQMEPATFRDIITHYLRYHKNIEDKIKQICHVTILNPIDLINNDRLAICMCRVHYLRQKGAIPIDLNGWAQYWKQHYNTPLGKGTEEEFVSNYHLWVVGDKQ